ncbi:hypothetical protein [Sulfuricurvum sp.]|uniref:hypothetical protein n=1 Tax=Sulfuricurvum sp. TaxID=2025608 RepID=UPI002D59C122|nr:hypothetical protein [Sulfuricurvum sp.]HZF71450.1 hypothetical protein [Sulfuricurvum sp.]
MQTIFEKLSYAAKININEYNNEYMNNISTIYPVVTNPNLLKSRIKTKNIQDAESLLRFSLVFNDLSLFTYNGGNELVMILLQKEWFEKNFSKFGAEIRLSKQKFDELGFDSENPQISPAFIFTQGDEINRFADQLYPFIANGRLLFQPDRSLLYLEGENENGGRTFNTLDVSQFSSLESWEIIDESNSRPISLQYESNNNLNQHSIFEITIPYLEGVKFSDLAKILEDENDLISGLRSSIKQAILESGDTHDLLTVRRDIIDPKIDALNRKFKSTVNSHAFRIAGAAVGTVALAYTSASTAGLSSAIATICGSGGIGLLGKEYSIYKEKINELRDDPYYFLWRCKNVAKHTKK